MNPGLDKNVQVCSEQTSVLCPGLRSPRVLIRSLSVKIIVILQFQVLCIKKFFKVLILHLCR